MTITSEQPQRGAEENRIVNRNSEGVHVSLSFSPYDPFSAVIKVVQLSAAEPGISATSSGLLEATL